MAEVYDASDAKRELDAHLASIPRHKDGVAKHRERIGRSVASIDPRSLSAEFRRLRCVIWRRTLRYCRDPWEIGGRLVRAFAIVSLFCFCFCFFFFSILTTQPPHLFTTIL
jgi:hypothetical protein